MDAAGECRWGLVRWQVGASDFMIAPRKSAFSLKMVFWDPTSLTGVLSEGLLLRGVIRWSIPLPGFPLSCGGE